MAVCGWLCRIRAEVWPIEGQGAHGESVRREARRAASRAAHESALAAGSKTKDFRSGLTAAKKARINTTSIELAALGMPIQEEIQRFLTEAATTLATV